MYYCAEDFLRLERMSNEELRETKLLAEDNYDYVQSLIKEDDGKGAFESVTIPLSTALDHLKNIESYIRKTENLLNGYEQDLTYVRQAIRRRNKRLLKSAFVIKTDEN